MLVISDEFQSFIEIIKFLAPDAASFLWPSLLYDEPEKN